MALFAEGRGDLRDAQGHFQDLVRDYPVSPFLEEAQEWLRDHRDAVAALPPEAPREAAPRPEPPPDPILVEERGNVAVQAGAFQSMDRARQLAARLRDAGFNPRLVQVPGSELARVRMGRFPSRDEADTLADRIRNLGFEVTIVTDADAEEEIG
jgi:cell division septation protein DedD